MGGSLVALMLLVFFYSIVATAVDRGERRVFVHDQSDIDEDLRTPAGSGLVARTASPR